MTAFERFRTGDEADAANRSALSLALRTLVASIGRSLRSFSTDLSERKTAIGDAYAKQQRGDYASAFEAWAAISARWPDDVTALSSLAACARETGKLGHACDVIDEALQRFPRHPKVLVEAALNDERRGRWTSSIRHWEIVVRRREAHAAWGHLYIHNLLVLGRLDEAEARAERWCRRFPEHRGLMAVQAMVASERGRLDDALSMWSRYRALFPDDSVGWEHYGRAYQARQIAQLDRTTSQSAQDVAAMAAIERHEDPETRALLMKFESLGHDCEFGLVQRRYGAEPLGLLRFNAVAYGDLVTAIANGFSRMGEPDVTELTTVGNGEYFVRDRRWGLGMHTFVFEGQENADALFRKFCRRVAYLRDKFLEDLRDGRKILVFTYPGLSRDDLVMLHRALRSLGPVRLLYVSFGHDTGGGFETPAADGVQDLGNGLFVGRLSRSGRTASNVWDIAFEEWALACRQVHDLSSESVRPDQGVS